MDSKGLQKLIDSAPADVAPTDVVEVVDNNISETPRRQLSGSHAHRFVLGGDWNRQNATFTLKSVKTGQHFTFKVSAPEKQTNPDQPILFVGLLSGPDNTSDYRYMGLIVNPTNPRFITTKGTRIGPDAPSMKALQWAFPKLVTGNVPDTLEIWHEGKCCRCGRTLTVPESIEAGIGPVCAGKDS